MERSFRTVIITQARTGSTRLPNKVLLKINNQEMLSIHINRLKQSRLANQVIVATTLNSADHPIETLCKATNTACFRGSENDVLDRYYQCAKELAPEWVVRVTSDCPLIDPELIDAVILCAQTNNADYCSTGLLQHFPDGQDVEVFKFSSLEKAWTNARLSSEREHVTPYIISNSSLKGGKLFSSVHFPCIADYNTIRMTVDEPKDFELVKLLIENLGTQQSWLSYVQYVKAHNLGRINGNIIRNEGYLKSLQNDQ